MKFGTAEGTFGPSAVPSFALLGDIWGFAAQKTRQFAKKFPKLQTFSPRRGESLARFLVKFMCYMRVTCLLNVLKFGAIWFINGKFIATKLRWDIPPKFSKPASSKLLVEHKTSRWAQKWYGIALSTCQVWWRSAAARRRERKNVKF